MQRLGRWPRSMRRLSGSSGALALLGAEPDGVAWDFRDSSIVVRDTTTPANNFAGNVNDWFTYTAPSAKNIRNSAGLLVSGSTLRTEYDAALLPLGVRIEPAATNLQIRSQELANVVAWTNQRTLAFGAGSTADVIAAPDGTLTADFVVEDSSAGVTHNMYGNSNTISAGAVTTYSHFFKSGTRTQCRLEITSNGGANGGRCIFNLATGAVGASSSVGTGAFISSSIEAWANGWYRCGLTVTVDPAATLATPLFGLVDGSGNTAYNGDGVSGLYVWGAQHEVGRWASSYIPTTSATVTRVKDDVLKLITAMPFSATAGTLFAEFSTASPELAGTPVWYGASLNDGTINEFVGVLRYQATIGGAVSDGGVFQADIRRAAVVSTGFEMHRTAIAWAANDAQACTDGTLTASDASVTLPTMTRLELGRGGLNQVGGHMKRALYVPRRVADAALQTMGS